MEELELESAVSSTAVVAPALEFTFGCVTASRRAATAIPAVVIWCAAELKTGAAELKTEPALEVLQTIAAAIIASRILPLKVVLQRLWAVVAGSAVVLSLRACLCSVWLSLVFLLFLPIVLIIFSCQGVCRHQSLLEGTVDTHEARHLRGTHGSTDKPR